VLVLCAVGPYLNGLNAPLIFDDLLSIPYNPHRLSLWPLTEAMQAPDESAAAGRPVVALSIAVQHAIHGDDVRGYHLANTLLHAINTLLLWAVLRHLLGLPRWDRRLGGHSAVVAWLATVLWAVHPLHSETVQYVIQRTELLAALFTLLTVYASLRWWRDRRAVWLIVAWAGCALGVASKELVAVVPLLIIALQWTLSRTGGWDERGAEATPGRAGQAGSPGDEGDEVAGNHRRVTPAGCPAFERRPGGTNERRVGRFWRWSLLTGHAWPPESSESAPGVIASFRARGWLLPVGLAGSWLVLAACLMVGGRDDSVALGMDYTWWSYLQTQAGVLLEYLRMSVWPTGLSIVHHAPAPEAWHQWVPQGLVVFILLGVTVGGLLQRRWWGFVGVWCFLILAPTSSVLPITYEPMAERRMYLPLMALVPAVMACLVALAQHVPGRRKTDWQRAALPRGVVFASLLVAAGFVTLTTQRVHDYRSQQSIWADAVAKQPDSFQAHHSYALALSQVGDFGGAVRHYERAIELRPHYLASRINLATLHWRLGQLDRAERGYRYVIRQRPSFAAAHHNLALLLATRGHHAEALEHARLAVDYRPNYPAAQRHLARLQQQLGVASVPVE